MGMNDYDCQMIGNLGVHVNEKSVIAFQLGTDPLGVMDDPGFGFDRESRVGQPQTWLSVKGYQVAARGLNNLLVEEIEHDISGNRILPRLYQKQATILYGQGPMLYRQELSNNKVTRRWIENKAVTDYFNAWMLNGLEQSAEDCIKANIKNFYSFRDYFTKVRMSMGKYIGKNPIAGLESMENSHCRLATTRQDVAIGLMQYRDLKHVLVGRWLYGGSNFDIYPRFNVRDLDGYRFAAVSHHREKSINNFYGNNETHMGTRAYIRGANKTPNYINSFLKNSMAAKVHVIIPDSYLESKRSQIAKLCQENKKRVAENKTPLLFNEIEIGTEFRESSLIQYINQQLRFLTSILSGEDNQGKAFVSYSYRVGQNKEMDTWKIENLDMKYKEYIESLISYDKRADEVISTSIGMDPSISAISKDGIISKSGSDLYYNYLIYLISLTPDEEKVCEPFNQICLALNFPDLYAQGYRIGLYREVPSKQEEVAPSNRLNTTAQ